MTPEDQVAKLNAWQNNPYAHPLTCNKDSRHNPLVPVIKDGSVILRCSDCGYEQLWIPAICLGIIPDFGVLKPESED